MTLNQAIRTLQHVDLYAQGRIYMGDFFVDWGFHHPFGSSGDSPQKTMAMVRAFIYDD